MTKFSYIYMVKELDCIVEVDVSFSVSSEVNKIKQKFNNKQKLSIKTWC